MLQGQTQTATFRDTHSASVAYDALPTVAVIQPDGTTLSPALTVTSSPTFSTAATAHTLAATDDFTQAGEYAFRWSRIIGGVTSVYSQVVFAAWTDVYSRIRTLLNRTATQLPDSTIDIELARLTRLLLADYTCLGAYNDLTGLDRVWFDEALVYMATASIRPTLPAISGSTGEIKSKEQGGLKVTYATTSSNAQSTPIDETWMDTAWQAFLHLTCVAAAFASVRTGFRPFSLGGRRRAAEKAGYAVADTNPLLRYLIDEERRMQGIGVNN